MENSCKQAHYKKGQANQKNFENLFFGHHLDGKSYCADHVETSIMLNKRRGKNNTSFDCPMFRNKFFVMNNIWFRYSIPHGFTLYQKIRSFEEKNIQKSTRSI